MFIGMEFSHRNIHPYEQPWYDSPYWRFLCCSISSLLAESPNLIINEEIINLCGLIYLSSHTSVTSQKSLSVWNFLPRYLNISFKLIPLKTIVNHILTFNLKLLPYIFLELINYHVLFHNIHSRFSQYVLFPTASLMSFIVFDSSSKASFLTLFFPSESFSMWEILVLNKTEESNLCFVKED